MKSKTSVWIMLTLLVTTLLTLAPNIQQVEPELTARIVPSELQTTVCNKQKHVDLVLITPDVITIGEYDWLKMPNCSYISTPGHPMLPIKSVSLTLPLNSNLTQLSAKIENLSLKEEYIVMPTPNPVQVGSDRPSNEIAPEPTIYLKDELYPEKWFVYRVSNGLDPTTATRVKYVNIYFYPLRYLPTQKEVFFAQKVSFTVSYTEFIDEQTVGVGLQNLVVTSPLLEQQAIRLAGWKNSTGIPSRVLNTTWIYSSYAGTDNQEKIRTCIKDFVSEHQITYVTLFGDADQVPVRYAYVPDPEAGETYVPTDLYYADLDGTWDDNLDGLFADQRYDDVDGMPDVYVGRITVSTVEYATSTVTKIMNYQNQNMSAEWAKKVVLAAGTEDGGDGRTGTTHTDLNEYISSFFSNRTIVRLYESYGNCTTSLMLSETNEGAAFINFAGHGDPGDDIGAAGWLFFWVFDYLIFECFHVPLVQSLTNGWKLPVVTTMSCSTARFDDHESVGEWWLANPDGGGIAYFGATRIAWAYLNEWVTIGLMGEMDWRIYEAFYEGYTKLGQMWGVPIARYVQSHIWNYQYASVHDVKTLMEFIMFGDPTLRIYNGPETLNVPDEYATIQKAINAAYNGDTIQVATGIYYENVVVNKSVSLVGQNPVNTIVDGGGSGDVIRITADNVLIENFTIRNGQNEGVEIASVENCIVRNNNLIDNRYGIYLYSSNYSTVSGNNITRMHADEGDGIRLSYSNHTTVTGNNITIKDAMFASGISLSYSSSNNLSGNYIETDGWMSWGIDLWFCSNNTLSGNDMRSYGDNLDVEGSTLNHFMHSIDDSNLVWGKPVYYLVNQKDLVMNPGTHPQVGYLALINSTNITVEDQTLESNDKGILLLYTNNSRIVNNTIKNNQDGVSLRGSLNNTISGNNIMHNWGAPDAPEGDGIQLAEGSSDNTISGNNITNNGGKGITLGFSNNTTISGNNITDNGYHGIVLSSSNYTSISGNNITKNGDGYWGPYSGVFLSSSCERTHIYGNNIAENYYAGIELGGSSNNIIYENNITRNQHGIDLGGDSSNNTIYHNNFLNNTQQVYDWSPPSINVWDDDYPSGGNYWNDYASIDLYWGPYQNETGSDGIGDNPYVIDASNSDNYPLMSPYEYWIDPILGDINKDMKVDHEDLSQLATPYGSTPEKTNWNPNSDIDNNGLVDIFDIGITSAHWGQIW